MNRCHHKGALLAAVLGGAALSAGALVPTTAAARRRRRIPRGAHRAAPGRATDPCGRKAVRAGAGRPGAAPRRGPRRTEPRRAGAGGGGRVDAGFTAVPPLPDLGPVRGCVRTERGRGGAGVLRAANRGADGRDARAREQPAADQRHGGSGVVCLRNAAAVGPGAEPGQGPREHRVAADPCVLGRRRHRRGRVGRPVQGALDAQAERSRFDAGGRRRCRHSACPGRGRPRRHAPGVPIRPGQRNGRELYLDPDGLHLRPRPALRAGADGCRADDRHCGVRAVPPERLRRVRLVLRPV